MIMHFVCCLQQAEVDHSAPPVTIEGERWDVSHHGLDAAARVVVNPPSRPLIYIMAIYELSAVAKMFELLSNIICHPLCIWLAGGPIGAALSLH
jgi:hypothetical protein